MPVINNLTFLDQIITVKTQKFQKSQLQHRVQISAPEITPVFQALFYLSLLYNIKKPKVFLQ